MLAQMHFYLVNYINYSVNFKFIKDLSLYHYRMNLESLTPADLKYQSN